jgi:DNA-binding NtrC family response regulator
MPGMNGIDLAKAVLDSHPACAVLLYTGTVNTTQELLKTSSGNGHDLRVLTKPLPPAELLTIVAQTLSNHVQEAESSTLSSKKATVQSSQVRA